MSKLDWLDKAIITILNQDARLPSAQIAKRLGVSERTAHNRVQRLIRTGVIKPVAVVNPAAFGFTMAVDIFCELEVGYQERAVEAILSFPQVSYLAISTGDQDISLQAMFRDSEEMHAFITKQLHQIPGLRHTRTVLIPRILKDTYQWLPPDDSVEVPDPRGLQGRRR